VIASLAFGGAKQSVCTISKNRYQNPEKLHFGGYAPVLLRLGRI